ncbi:hypothetical protein D3C86_1929470 [compost metagenome]
MAAFIKKQCVQKPQFLRFTAPDMRIHEIPASKQDEKTLDQIMFRVSFAIALVASRYRGELANVRVCEHIRQIHHSSPHCFTTIMGNTALFIPFSQKK